MSLMNLSLDCKIVLMNTNVAAGTGTTNSSIFDMGAPQAAGGFDAILVLLALGTVTATSVITVRLQDNTANQAGGMTTVTASKWVGQSQNTANATVAQDSSNAGIVVTDVGGNSSNSVVSLDVILPQSRYVRAQIVVATANAVINSVVGILYRTKFKAITNDATNVAYAIAEASS